MLVTCNTYVHCHVLDDVINRFNVQNGQNAFRFVSDGSDGSHMNVKGIMQIQWELISHNLFI